MKPKKLKNFIKMEFLKGNENKTLSQIAEELFPELWSKYGVVYEKGKFATPSIPEYTQEEAENKFNIKIVEK